MSFSSFYRSKPIRIAASLVLGVLLAGPIQAAPWAGLPGMASEQLCGQGSFRFFGFKVYDARLFGACPGDVFSHPFALVLNYQRSISRDQLVQSSVDEIRRISGNTIAPPTLQRWRQEMRQSFVDVQSGDSITGVYLPGQGARFYVNDQLHHSIDDPQFARAFFGIWLDRDTRAPGLRASLLGQAP
jgi:hypothetical protein